MNLMARSLLLLIPGIVLSCSDPASEYTPPLIDGYEEGAGSRQGAADGSPEVPGGDPGGGFEDVDVPAGGGTPGTPGTGTPGIGTPGAPGAPGAPGGGTPAGGICGKASFKTSLDAKSDIDDSLTVPVMGNITFSIRSTVKMAFEFNEKTYTQTSRETILSVSPAMMESVMKEQLKGNNGPRTYHLAAADNPLFAGPGWQGLECLVIGVSSYVHGERNIRFEPAAPHLMIPWGDAAALRQALAKPRTFQVSATPVGMNQRQRDQEGVQELMGKKIPGTVTLSLVQPLVGDIGMKIKPEFGGWAETMATYGFQEVTYFWDSANRKIVGTKLVIEPLEGSGTLEILVK